MYSDLFSAESLADLQTVLPQIPFAIWETLYVTLLSTLLATVIGLPLGVLLVVGEKGGVLPLPKGVMHALNVLINLLRSIPFLILMIMVFPLSRLIIGTAVGRTAVTTPAFYPASPFVLRRAENVLENRPKTLSWTGTLPRPEGGHTAAHEGEHGASATCAASFCCTC